MVEWFLLSLLVGGVAGFLSGLKYEDVSPIFLGIIGLGGGVFLLEVWADFPSQMLWQCDRIYFAEEDQESCRLHANNFRWYLVAAGAAATAAFFLGMHLHDKRKERKQGS
jgi:hypothetical protein